MTYFKASVCRDGLAAGHNGVDWTGVSWVHRSSGRTLHWTTQGNGLLLYDAAAICQEDTLMTGGAIPGRNTRAPGTGNEVLRRLGATKTKTRGRATA